VNSLVVHTAERFPAERAAEPVYPPPPSALPGVGYGRGGCTYVRRQPENTVLHRVVREHLETVADCGLRITDCGLRIARMEEAQFMTKDELKRRTRQFALDVIRLVELLPRSRTTEVLGKQLLRSGTSVGANYRAACRAKSSADSVSKMGIVEEEADEAIYWMELLVGSGCVGAAGVRALLQEADQLLAITVSSIKTARITRDRNR
jgi:four helix bundle protein